MKQSKWSQILQWTLIVIMVIVSLFPLYLVLINAFKSHADIVANPLSFPLELYWQNFTKAWKNGHFGQRFLNSLRLAAITALIVLTASSLAGYVLGMKKFRGQKLVHVYFLMAMTVPVQLFLFPLYGALAKLGLIGSVYAVCFIIAAVNMPLAVMLMRTFFMKVPVQIEEAARLDGASTFQLLTRAARHDYGGGADYPECVERVSDLLHLPPGRGELHRHPGLSDPQRRLGNLRPGHEDGGRADDYRTHPDFFPVFAEIFCGWTCQRLFKRIK